MDMALASFIIASSLRSLSPDSDGPTDFTCQRHQGRHERYAALWAADGFMHRLRRTILTQMTLRLRVLPPHGKRPVASDLDKPLAARYPRLAAR